jgi:hypothetical protein
MLRASLTRSQWLFIYKQKTSQTSSHYHKRFIDHVTTLAVGHLMMENHMHTTDEKLSHNNQLFN